MIEWTQENIYYLALIISGLAGIIAYLVLVKRK